MLERVCRYRVLLILTAPRWPGRVWFPDIISLLDGLPLEPRPSGGTFCPKQGARYFTPNQNFVNCGHGLWGAQLIDSSLSTDVVETILHSGAPFTRKLYALKWRVFTSRCSGHQLDPVNCPVGTVLEFLQEQFTAGLAPSTLKVYLAAISAYHIHLGEMSLGKDPLVSCILRGTLRLRCCKPSDLLLFRMRRRKGTIFFAQCGH